MDSARQPDQDTYDSTRQSTRHEREAQEQDQPSLPRDASAGVGEAVGTEPRLLDRVDDEHAERRADAGDPVHELDVHVRPVLGRVRVRGRVDEEEEPQGELHVRVSLVVGRLTFEGDSGGNEED